MGTVAARLLHAPPQLAARGFTRCCEIQRAGGDLHLPIGCEQRRYLQNTKNATSKSVLVLFSDQLLFLPLFQI